MKIGRRLSAAAALMVGLWAFPSALHAQPAAVGGEFQANTYTSGFQFNPAVAEAADGTFVVVWESDGSADGDTSSTSVQAQRYDASGSSLGGQFQVNTYITDGQSNAAVAAAPDGDFVVVWQSYGSAYGDSSYTSIQAQRYAASGASLGGQYQVNTFATGFQRDPAIASLADGIFVVVWGSYGSAYDVSGGSIQAQRYSASGSPLGGQFQVNTFTTGDQSDPAVASAGDGTFVVVWRSFGSVGDDSAEGSIQAQRYDVTGSPLGGQFQVNSYTSGDQRYPAVALAPDGSFAVVWQSDGSAYGDTSLTSIQAQRYAASGVPVGGQFQVNSYSSAYQAGPAVAIDRDGDFVVTWYSFAADNGDPSGTSVQGRWHDVWGLPLGDEFLVNAHTPGNQFAPAVASDPDGDFVVVWTGSTSADDDDSGYSIHGQRFRVTGDVGDQVFFDLDLDGLQDVGELGVEGVAVHLFDSLGTPVRTTTTDASGEYRFEPKPGEYYLQFELPSAYSFTPQDRGSDEAADSDADVSTGETDTFAIALLGIDLDRDAGMASGIGDQVWLDGNGNGVQNGGELGIAGVGVELFTALGVSVDSTTTDADGRYSFPGIEPGVYYLEFTPPASAAFTLLDVGTDDSSDSDVDPLTGTTAPFTFVPGDLDVTWDAGIVDEVTVGDRVWLDDDGNGVQDGDEDGFSGVTVRLRESVTHAVVLTDTTDGGGFYGFVASPGTYYLEVELPGGFAFAPRDIGSSDGVDSDPNPTTGFTVAFTLGAGGPDLSWDAGLEPAVLGNQVWLDANGNGLQDAGEPGVSGVEVRLLDAGGALLQTASTDGDGRYAFDGLASGTYEVEFAPGGGWAFTAPKQGADPLRDSDADPVSGRTGAVVYEAASATRSLDAGLVQVPIFTDGFESGDTSAWSVVIE